MSVTRYESERGPLAAGMAQAGHAGVGAESPRSGAGVGIMPGGTEVAAVETADAALHRVAAGILGGAGPWEFQAGIEACHHEMGNRAFLHWVREWQGAGRGQATGSLPGEVTGEAVPVAASPVTVSGPLQLMPKKKKKKTVAAVEEESEVTTEASGGAGPGPDVGTVPVVAGGEPPILLSGPEQVMPQKQPEQSAVVGQKKKKKKPRVQVALNTLRSEGVEAFKSYIDTEIREAELLRTLTERIKRADNLRGNREEAMIVVEARLRILDPEAAARAPAAAEPGPGQGRAGPDIAPVKTELNPREDELFGCCASGNVRKFKRLLKYGKIDINMGSEYGTLLCNASFNGQAGLVRELLSMPGIDVNLAHQNGMTPLYFAAQAGHAEVVKLLLDARGINANSATLTGATPLNLAAQNGYVEVVKLLLAASGINVNLAEMEGVTPLYIAAQNGHGEVVKLLLAAPGINVNLAEMDRATPLYVAAQNGHVEVVRLLLAACGINANSAEMAGATPLCIAAQEGQEEVVELLLDAPTISIDARKADGATALFDAAQDNFPGIVELLIKRGADVNLMLDPGTTALDIAAHRGHVEVVRVLLQAPAIEVNHTTKSAITALAMACAKGHQDVVTLLLEKGADPNITFDSGIAPLHLACLRGRTDIVKILLDAGADMDGETAIITADEVTDSYTPYGIVELMGHREIMTLLEQHRQARTVQAVQVETLSPCLRPQGQAPEDEPGRPSPSMAAPEPASLPTAAPATQTEQARLTPSVAAESRATGGMEPPDRAPPSVSPEATVPGRRPAPAEPRTPLALGKQELVQEILRKLEQDNLEPLQGIRLLAEVRASASIDGLCRIYNRLAGIERRSERARRRGDRRREFAVGVEAQPAAGGAPRYVLGEKAGLDAEAVEDEIKGHLGQAYHRFVSQAVNDMEFGRGKPTSVYPGLLHASAGIMGLRSCSVFYYLDGSGERIRIVGIGHHVGQAVYRLDYADEDLGASRRTLRLA